MDGGFVRRRETPSVKGVDLGASKESSPAAPRAEEALKREKERALAALRAAMAQLEALGGEELLQAAVRTKGTSSVDELERILDSERLEKEFPAFFEAKLKEKGLLREEAGYTIVDVASLRNSSLRDLGFHQGQFGHLYEKGIYAVLAAGFQGKRIVSEEDWKESQRKKTPPIPQWPLYLPRSVKAATDPQSIKNARFYLAPWNVRGMSTNWDKPIEMTDGSMTWEELAIAGVIYHPTCGDGVRDESGTLLVRSGMKREYKKLTAAWFLEKAEDGEALFEGRNIKSGARWVAQHPLFEQKGILLQRDFSLSSIHSKDAERGIDAPRYVERYGTKNGNVTFHGIVHHIGKNYIGKDIVVAGISAHRGLICVREKDGSLKPDATFRLYTKEDPEVAILAQQGKFPSIGKNKLDFRTLSSGDLRSERYLEEGALINTYLSLKSSSPRTDSRLGDKVDRKIQLSPETLLRYTEWMQSVPQSTQIVFRGLVDKFGELGARFSLCFQKEQFEVLADFCRRVDTLGVPVSRAIMERCLELNQSGADELKRLINETVEDTGTQTDDLEKTLRQEVSRRWIRILSQLSQEKKLSFELLSVRLQGLKKENALYASLCRSVFKGKSVEESRLLLRGLTMDALIPARSEIDARTKKEMEEIFDTNWVDQDQVAAKSFKQSLHEKLNDVSGETMFYVLRKDGEIMAFIRFDTVGEHDVKGGSLNVNPAFRQSGLGEMFMQKTIDQVAQEKVIHAHVVPDAVVGATYVEQMHCVITGVDVAKDRVTGKEGAMLRLRRDDARHYRTRASLTTWQALQAGSVPGVEVKKFDLKTQREAFLQAITQAAAQGKVVTRYLADPHHPMTRWIALEHDVAPTPETRSPT